MPATRLNGRDRDRERDREELLPSPASSSASSPSSSRTFSSTRHSILSICIGSAVALFVSVLMFTVITYHPQTSGELRQLIIPDSDLQLDVQCATASGSPLRQYNYSEWLALDVDQRYEYATRHPQPLPYCHHYNSRLQQSIMHWLHAVQVPAVKQLKQHNTTSNGFLIFEVVEYGANGGYVDRQRGIMSTLMWAWSMGRPFAIRYNYPSPLHDALECNLLDWNLDEWLLPICPKTPEQQQVWWRMLPTNDRCSHLSVLDFDLRHNLTDQLLYYTPPSTNVLVNTNVMWLHTNLMLHPVLGPRLRDFGFIFNQPFFHHWACISELLYLPQQRTVDLMQKSLQHVGYQLVWPSFSATTSETTTRQQRLEHQRGMPVFAPESLLLPLNSAHDTSAQAPTSLHCLQYRRGKSTTFHDQNDIATLETLQQAINTTVASVMADVQLGLQPLVFVSSDSLEPKPLHLMTAALQQMTDNHYAATNSAVHVPAFEVQGVPVHVDWTITGNPDDDIKVVADNWMLGYCQHAIVTSSGFGISGVWRTNSATDRWYIIPSYYEFEKNQISRVYQIR